MSSGVMVAESSQGRGWDYTVIRDRLTVERLGSYLAATDQDIERALHLHRAGSARTPTAPRSGRRSSW